MKEITDLGVSSTQTSLRKLVAGGEDRGGSRPGSLGGLSRVVTQDAASPAFEDPKPEEQELMSPGQLP